MWLFLTRPVGHGPFATVCKYALHIQTVLYLYTNWAVASIMTTRSMRVRVEPVSKARHRSRRHAELTVDKPRQYSAYLIIWGRDMEHSRMMRCPPCKIRLTRLRCVCSLLAHYLPGFMRPMQESDRRQRLKHSRKQTLQPSAVVRGRTSGHRDAYYRHTHAMHPRYVHT